MKAEIKKIFSTDIQETLDRYKPENESNFGFNLRIIIGPKGEKGEESFDMMVCTPEWLNENNKEDEIIFGRHFLIVFRYDFQAIYKRLSEYINEIEANSWDDVCVLISRIGYWEFEDYKN